MEHGAKLSFPCQLNIVADTDQGDVSALQYVLKELQNKQLARCLMKRGVCFVLHFLASLCTL